MDASIFVRALLVLVAILASGCVVLPPAPGDGDAPPEGWRTLRHEGDRLLAVDEAAPRFFLTPILDTGPPSVQHLALNRGARPSEPTLGATSSGALFIMIWENVVRSLDGGRSWHLASVPANGQATVDPYLHVDPATDRVFELHLYEGACSWLAWSDDDGASWTSNPGACHHLGGFDHPKLVSVERTSGVPESEYGRVLVYAYNAGRSSRASLSFDGGLTWPMDVETVPHDVVKCDYGLHGDPATTARGGVHIPKGHCEGLIVASSADSGRTWSSRVVGAEAGGAPCRANPALASDGDRAMTAVWAGEDNRLWGAGTRDAGASWSPAFRVSPPGVAVATMPAAVGRADGLVAVLYYGAQTPAESPDAAPDETLWHAYLSWSRDGRAWDTLRLTDDPAQVGPIDVAYDCESAAGTRNLLDFIDVALAPDGKVVAAFNDGCIDGCARHPDMDASRARRPVFASVDVDAAR